MQNPNVLYIAIDSLRLDAVRHTETIQRLADENVWFPKALTPATWSLPAYTSLLTGQYPHEHGITQPGDIPDSLPLVETLSDRGYRTYGVSGNPFFAPSQGFDSPFDRFWLTPRMWYPEGIDVSNYESELKQVISGSPLDRLVNAGRFTSALMRHPHRLKSLVNIGFFLGHRLDLDQRIGRTIAHPLFDKPAYRPQTNTAIVERILEEEATDADPFFLFVQYNDPHHVNWPPDDILEGIDGIDDTAEIVEVNELTASIGSMARELDEETLQKRRQLYRGDVESVDRHIGRLQRTLQRLGLADDTVIVLTADHGENLGEADRRGRRRIGHFASLAEHLVRVPLIVAHPDAEPASIDEWVSTKDVCHSILDRSLFGEGQLDGSTLIPESGTVLTESPAKGSTDLVVGNNPDVPEAVIREETAENAVLGKFGAWTAVESSMDEVWAWQGEAAKPYEEAPEPLRDHIGASVRALSAAYRDQPVSDPVRRRLEELGYA